jgi:hypothetical protein
VRTKRLLLSAFDVECALRLLRASTDVLKPPVPLLEVSLIAYDDELQVVVNAFRVYWDFDIYRIQFFVQAFICDDLPQARRMDITIKPDHVPKRTATSLPPKSQMP